MPVSGQWHLVTRSLPLPLLADHLLDRGHLHIRSRRHLWPQIAHKPDDASNATRPAGLVTSANARPVVAVEVFVKQDVVLLSSITINVVDLAIGVV